MAEVVGPDFVALQVKDIRRSREFYTEQLGLRPVKESPPGAVVFETKPIPFAIREPLVDLSATSKLGWGISLWFSVSDIHALRGRLQEQGVRIIRDVAPGPFGPNLTFEDPDGYLVTLHQPPSR
jgi:catechol 2,3-dioxygenase-like lactoylglutathione lyase family enzyme